MADFSKGWIILLRTIQDNFLWKIRPYSKGQAWVDLILTANHQNNKVLIENETLLVKRGELITSQRKLAEKWGWSRNTVRTFLALLEKEKMIELKTTHQLSHLIIINYNRLQKISPTNRAINEPPIEPPLSHPLSTNKECKECKEWNNVKKRDILSGNARLSFSYICGFIDGEGTLRINKMNVPIEQNSKGFSLMARLEICNTNLNILNQIKEIFKVGSITTKYNENEHHKDLYCLSISQKELEGIIPLIKPYLKIKNRHLAIIEDFLKFYPIDIEKSLECYEKIKILNEKGKPDLEAPILYLNEKVKSHFDPKNKSSRTLIKARYAEGRTLEQFKQVIDKKVAQWFNDEKMLKYLRPSTLFNATNFENYLNEPFNPEIESQKTRKELGLK